MTLSIMTLDRITLFVKGWIATLRKTLYFTLLKSIILLIEVTVIVVMLNAECHQAEHHNADCRFADFH